MSIQLIIQQQPKQARQCSFKERLDRRPIDPPPILQIKGHDSTMLDSPYLFVITQLVDSVHLTPIAASNKSGPILFGTTCQSLRKLKALDNSDMGLFMFQDLSIKLDGLFKLKFGLYEIKAGRAVLIDTAVSDEFRVYQPKMFPGMGESTFLTRLCASQGMRVRVRRASTKSFPGQTNAVSPLANSNSAEFENTSSTTPNLPHSLETPKLDQLGWQGFSSNQPPIQPYPHPHLQNHKYHIRQVNYPQNNLYSANYQTAGPVAQMSNPHIRNHRASIAIGGLAHNYPNTQASGLNHPCNRRCSLVPKASVHPYHPKQYTLPQSSRRTSIVGFHPRPLPSPMTRTMVLPRASPFPMPLQKTSSESLMTRVQVEHRDFSLLFTKFVYQNNLTRSSPPATSPALIMNQAYPQHF